MRRVPFASKHQLYLRKDEVFGVIMDDFGFERIVGFNIAFERKHVF
jgi:hypothetical protein